MQVERAISENVLEEFVKFKENSEETDDNGFRRGHTLST
jgi:hypothetical protein